MHAKMVKIIEWLYFHSVYKGCKAASYLPLHDSHDNIARLITLE
jgi:hypothetical protein